MKISFDEATMPDALYNVLLQYFVTKAVAEGVKVTKNTKFTDWVIECEVAGVPK